MLAGVIEIKDGRGGQMEQEIVEERGSRGKELLEARRNRGQLNTSRRAATVERRMEKLHQIGSDRTVLATELTWKDAELFHAAACEVESRR